MDAVETETVVYIMTERVRPLTSVLPAWVSRGAAEREDWLLWGLHRISVNFPVATLIFLLIDYLR